MTMEGVTMDRDGFLYVVNENGGGDANHPELWVYAHSDAPNLAPTAVVLNNAVTSIPENTSTAAPVKLADIVVTDDGLGTNNLTVTGADAGSFQIIGTGLYLKAGTPLSSSAKPSYSVTVNVDDPAVGSTPDASTNFTLTITASTGGASSLIISEVAPWSSGNSTLGRRLVRSDEYRHRSSEHHRLENGRRLQFLRYRVAFERHHQHRTRRVGDLHRKRQRPRRVHVPSSSGSGRTRLRISDRQLLRFGRRPQHGRRCGQPLRQSGTKQAGVTFGASRRPARCKTFDNAAGLNNGSDLDAERRRRQWRLLHHRSRQRSAAPRSALPGTIGAPPTPVVTITATDANAAETGSDPGTFRISRTGSTVGALTVNYTIATGAGQATSADYTPTLTGVVTIPSGQSFVDITITPVDDALFEGPETLTLTLFDTGSYDVGAPSTATVTIADNDPPDTMISSRPTDPSATAFAQFAFTGSQPLSAIARFECSLDGKSFTICNSPVNYSNLSEGVTRSQCERSMFPATSIRRPRSSLGRWTRRRRPSRLLRARIRPLAGERKAGTRHDHRHGRGYAVRCGPEHGEFQGGG